MARRNDTALRRFAEKSVNRALELLSYGSVEVFYKFSQSVFPDDFRLFVLLEES